MKDYGLKIKIADLLNNPGNSDTIKFEKKFTKTADYETINGISGEVYLQGLSHYEILLKPKKLKFSINYICDKCGKKYSQEYEILNEEDVRFVDPNEIEINESIHDTVFPIDIKNQTIDISELLDIIVKNQEPIVKDCGNHKNEEEIDEEIFQEEFQQEGTTLGNLLKIKKNVKN